MHPTSPEPDPSRRDAGWATPEPMQPRSDVVGPGLPYGPPPQAPAWPSSEPAPWETPASAFGVSGPAGANAPGPGSARAGVRFVAVLGATAIGLALNVLLAVVLAPVLRPEILGRLLGPMLLTAVLVAVGLWLVLRRRRMPFLALTLVAVPVYFVLRLLLGAAAGAS
jgi:hypothetical protein